MKQSSEMAIEVPIRTGATAALEFLVLLRLAKQTFGAKDY